MPRHTRTRPFARLRAAAPPLLCLLFALALTGGSAARSQDGADESKWETTTSGGMSFSLPGKPKEQTQTVQSPSGPVEVRITSFERGREAFMVAHTEFPAQIANSPALANPKVLLDTGRDGALRNVNGKLISERDLVLNGHPGREVVGEVSEKKSAFTARIYWAKPNLYQIVYIHTQGTAVSADGRKFLDSLKIEKPAAPPN